MSDTHVSQWRSLIASRINHHVIDFQLSNTLPTISKDITDSVRKSFTVEQSMSNIATNTDPHPDVTSKSNILRKKYKENHEHVVAVVPMTHTANAITSNSHPSTAGSQYTLPTNCQLPDLLARLLRDETHPNTRFQSLSEIPNFQYRLKWANVSITETFQYLIEIIQEVEQEEESVGKNSSNNTTTSSTSGSTNYSETKKSKEASSSITNTNDCNNIDPNHENSDDRATKTTEVLSFAGIDIRF